MVRMKLTAKKHVRAPPCRNVVPAESHNDSQNAGYIPRTLRTVLLALGSSEPPLFTRTLRLLHGNLYLWPYTQLFRYVPHEVDTDEKKQEYFLNGFNDGLAYALEAQDFENFQGMVNMAFVLENRTGMMECKHKLVHQNQPDSSSRPRVTMPSAGPVFCPA
jgi:hypothetical protein